MLLLLYSQKGLIPIFSFGQEETKFNSVPTVLRSWYLVRIAVVTSGRWNRNFVIRFLSLNARMESFDALDALRLAQPCVSNGGAAKCSYQLTAAYT